MIDVMIGVLIMVVIEIFCYRKYGSPFLSIFIAKAYYSKNFKWLAYRVWGADESWYYKTVIDRMNNR